MDTKIPAAGIPLPLAEKLDRLAARVGPHSDAIVADALSAWLDREDRPEAMTLEALEEVDAGRLVDHQTVKEWAGSRLAETLPTAEWIYAGRAAPNAGGPLKCSRNMTSSTPPAWPS